MSTSTMNTNTTNPTLEDLQNAIAAAKVAKKAVMKAARHLSATRMAWVANRWTNGIDWRGSTKGRIAESLVRVGRYATTIPTTVSQSTLDTLCYRLRLQVNTRGETALIAEDSDRINFKVATLRAKVKRLKLVMGPDKNGQINWKVEYEHRDAGLLANRLESALKKALA